MNFDPGPWTDIGAIDRRHVQWIASVLASGRFRRVLEIGCQHGYSTSAFLWALKEGFVQEVHLCEPSPPTDLLELFAAHSESNIYLHKVRSIEILGGQYNDLVCIDGDHSRANMQQETNLILEHKIPAVFAHDTNICGLWQAGQDDGPALLKSRLVFEGYQAVEDYKKRPNEWTERGMVFLSTSPELIEIARKAGKEYDII